MFSSFRVLMVSDIQGFNTQKRPGTLGVPGFREFRDYLSLTPPGGWRAKLSSEYGT